MVETNIRMSNYETDISRDKVLNIVELIEQNVQSILRIRL